LNVGTPNFIKQKLVDIKSQIDPNTIAVGDFNSPLSSSRPKKNQQGNFRIK
jgi:hypothetical protein